MKISFIVAMDKNRLIGSHNELPWHLPADLAFFKKTTMGHPIIMGRRTYESIGRPLPGRRNIILTKNEDYSAEGCEIVSSVDEALLLMKETAAEDAEAFVIGGAEIFSLFFPDVDKLYITEIDASFEGDTYFPEINPNQWTIVSKIKGIKDERNPYNYSFVIYERNLDSEKPKSR